MGLLICVRERVRGRQGGRDREWKGEAGRVRERERWKRSDQNHHPSSASFNSPHTQ